MKRIRKARAPGQLSAAARLSKGRSVAKHKGWPEPPEGFKYCVDCSEEKGEPTYLPVDQFYPVKSKKGMYFASYCKKHHRQRIELARRVRESLQS